MLAHVHVTCAWSVVGQKKKVDATMMVTSTLVNQKKTDTQVCRVSGSGELFEETFDGFTVAAFGRAIAPKHQVAGRLVQFPQTP
jgi:hypothetical protein